MVKVCPVCGKKFVTKNAVKFCSNTCRRKHQAVEKPTKRRSNETLCWTCQNATGGCSWSARLEPVEGWKAKKIKVKGDFYTGEILDSYIVKSCPKYIQDSKE